MTNAMHASTHVHSDTMHACARRFRDEGDDRSMEVGWKEMVAEEKRSARLGVDVIISPFHHA